MNEMNISYDPSIYDETPSILEQLEEVKELLEQGGGGGGGGGGVPADIINRLEAVETETASLREDIESGDTFNYVRIDDIARRFEGSDTIVVDVNEEVSAIEMHLDADIVSDISKSVKTPMTRPQSPQVPVLQTTGAINWTNVSDIGGGGGGSTSGGGTQFYRIVANGEGMSAATDFVCVFVSNVTEEEFTRYRNIGELLTTDISFSTMSPACTVIRLTTRNGRIIDATQVGEESFNVTFQGGSTGTLDFTNARFEWTAIP